MQRFVESCVAEVIFSFETGRNGGGGHVEMAGRGRIESGLASQLIERVGVTGAEKGAARV